VKDEFGQWSLGKTTETVKKKKRKPVIKKKCGNNYW
jgi:hypothetical protein